MLQGGSAFVCLPWVSGGGFYTGGSILYKYGCYFFEPSATYVNWGWGHHTHSAVRPYGAASCVLFVLLRSTTEQITLADLFVTRKFACIP